MIRLKYSPAALHHSAPFEQYTARSGTEQKADLGRLRICLLRVFSIAVTRVHLALSKNQRSSERRTLYRSSVFLFYSSTLFLQAF